MAVTIPAKDRKAANLQFLSLAVSTISLFLFRPPFKPSPYLSESALNITLIITLLLMIGLIWEVREGKRWAKVVLLLLFVPGTILALARLPHLLAAPGPQILLSLLTNALQVASIFIIARDLLRQPVAVKVGYLISPLNKINNP